MEKQQEKQRQPRKHIFPAEGLQGGGLLAGVGIDFRRRAVFRCGKHMNQSTGGDVFPATFAIELDLFFRQAGLSVQ